jgi:hypothetical protein
MNIQNHSQIYSYFLKSIAFLLISLFVAGCDPEKSEVYLGIQPNTETTAQLTEDVWHFMAKRSRNSRISIDLLKGDSAQTIYSNPANKRALQELRQTIDPNPNTPEMDIIPSSDRALVAAFQRFKDLAIANGDKSEFHAYILTAGTTDERTLSQLKTICEKLAEQTDSDFHIYLIGLTEANRLKTVSALHPIAAHAHSAGESFSEVQKLIRKF